MTLLFMTIITKYPLIMFCVKKIAVTKKKKKCWDVLFDEDDITPASRDSIQSQTSKSSVNVIKWNLHLIFHQQNGGTGRHSFFFSKYFTWSSTNKMEGQVSRIQNLAFTKAQISKAQGGDILLNFHLVSQAFFVTGGKA